MQLHGQHFGGRIPEMQGDVVAVSLHIHQGVRIEMEETCRG